MTTTEPTASGWTDFATQAPDLAAATRARLEAAKHHVLATIRRDGSPRVSGTEVQFHALDLYMGSMGGALKAVDLRREPRFALHSHPGDSTMEGGDAKLAGVADEVLDEGEIAGWLEGREMPPGTFHLFRLSLTQVTVTSLHPDGDRLVLRTWHPGGGVDTVERN